MLVSKRLSDRICVPPWKHLSAYLGSHECIQLHPFTVSFSTLSPFHSIFTKYGPKISPQPHRMHTLPSPSHQDCDPSTHGVAEFFRKASIISQLLHILSANPWNAETIRVLQKYCNHLDPFVVGQLLKTHISIDTAFGFFKWLKTIDGFTHNLHTYRSIIVALADSQRVDDMKAVIKDCEEQFQKKASSKSVFSKANMMQFYGRAQYLEGALSMWHDMKKSQAKPTVESYNVLIDLLAQQGLYQESASTYLEMVHEGRLPSARTITVLIKHLTKANKLDAAMELFHKIPQLKVQSNTRQFRILINAFSEIADAYNLKLLIKRLREEGHRSELLVHVALQALRAAGKSDDADLIAREYGEGLNEKQGAPSYKLDASKAIDLFDEADDDAEQTYCRINGIAMWLNPNALADVIKDWTHSTEVALAEAKVHWDSSLIDVLLRSFKKTEVAWKFFCWVSYEPGFKHDSYTFSRMIRMFAVEGDDERVNLLLEQSQREGVYISLGIIHSIIVLRGTQRKWMAAMEIFHNIELFGHKPNKCTYSILIYSLVKADKCTEALEILSDMQCAGHKPDVDTYTVLIDRFALNGNVRMAHLVFTWILQSGRTPNSHSYNSLIKAYCRVGDFEAALKLFNEMVDMGIELTAATKSQLVNSLLRESKHIEAREIYKRVPSKVSHGGISKPFVEDLMFVYSLYSSHLPGTVRSD